MLWLFACTTAEPELAPEPLPVEPSYVALLEQEPQAALLGCAELEDERERGDCTLFAVMELGRLKEDALGACLDLGNGWRELCVLEYSDAARLTGAAAEEACRYAGDLRERCIAHVISREVSNYWLETGLSGEAGLLAWTEARLVEVDYASFPSARKDLATELVADLVSGDSSEWAMQRYLRSRTVALKRAAAALTEGNLSTGLVMPSPSNRSVVGRDGSSSEDRILLGAEYSEAFCPSPRRAVCRQCCSCGSPHRHCPSPRCAWLEHTEVEAPSPDTLTTGFSDSFPRQVTLNASSADENLTVELLESLEAAARKDGIVLQVEGALIENAEATPVTFQFFLGAYVQTEGDRKSFTLQELTSLAAEGGFIGTFTGHDGEHGKVKALSTGISTTPGTAAEPETDVPSYLALLDEEPQAALQGCAELEDERERGDCTLFAVVALGKLKQDALGPCLDLGDGWRELCVLEYSDAAQLTGPAADEACRHAGDLKERCLAYVISREVANRWPETEWGGEAGLLAWTEARVVEVDYASFLTAREGLAIELVAGLVSEDRIGPGAEYGEALCGTLPDEACNEVIHQALKRQNVPYAACVHKEPALARDDHDMPSWHESLDDRMVQAWELYCQDVPAEEEH